ncbi:hypothetical protein [Chitinimonas koreensis]|uniref:hypothetical protein n=1 Tax=Chitinimonas koreensis TaxID=356302 RepID=UPI0012FC36AD|nr:hypothetical protein [Chitinimonas koreensis]QNM97655.1 hypothetical protein H9L41_04975 [Chitinimonas koreensis]
MQVIYASQLFLFSRFLIISGKQINATSIRSGAIQMAFNVKPPANATLDARTAEVRSAWGGLIFQRFQYTASLLAMPGLKPVLLIIAELPGPMICCQTTADAILDLGHYSLPYLGNG